MAEIHRVAAPDANIVVIEYNRWNPIGYVHLVRGGEHDHMSRAKLTRLVEPWLEDISWTSLENHVYPRNLEGLSWATNLYEAAMERIPLLNSLCSYFVVAGRPKQGVNEGTDTRAGS